MNRRVVALSGGVALTALLVGVARAAAQDDAGIAAMFAALEAAWRVAVRVAVGVALVETLLYRRLLSFTWPQAVAAAAVGNVLAMRLVYQFFLVDWHPVTWLLVLLVLVVVPKLAVVGLLNLRHPDKRRLFRVAALLSVGTFIAAIPCYWGLCNLG